MLIGVLSDTHISHLTDDFKDFFLNRFSHCDIVVHAGDFTSPDLYYYLNELIRSKFIAVHGNMDPPELHNLLPQKRIITIEGSRIGIIHGWGSPFDLEERIEKIFYQDGLGCIIYGHSHNGVNHIRNDILFFNPGSPTDCFHAKANSIGYLKIHHGKIEGEIVSVPCFSRGSPL